MNLGDIKQVAFIVQLADMVIQNQSFVKQKIKDSGKILQKFPTMKVIFHPLENFQS